MGGRFLIVIAMALTSCDEQVIPLDVIEEDAGESCDGKINDAGECIEQDRDEDESRNRDDDDDGRDDDGRDDDDRDDDDRDDDDRDDDDRDRRGRCDGLEDTIESCIENIGADDPWCTELQERYDEEC